MHRRLWLAALVSLALVIGLAPVASASAPPLPSSMAAVGDSITQAASSGGSLGTDYPANSWSTGTNSTVNSHYLRLLALNPGISGHNNNASVSGSKMVDLNAQMQGLQASHPDYLTVLIGGNDLCTDAVSQMTSVTDFRSQFVNAMGTLASVSPNTNVYVSSIPNVYHLWDLFKNNWWARIVWSAGNICQSLLANPTSTTAADVARRAEVAQRNIDYNTQLAEVCAAAPHCRWDGNAAYNTVFAKSDVSGDYFHPSIAGQAKLAAVSWGASYWNNQPPTASFTYSCTNLACSFDGTASSDSDGSIVSWAWTFGADGSGSGATASHTFTAGGTYNVTLLVTDDAGATGSMTRAVLVSDAPPTSTMSIGALTPSSSARKGGWTALVTISVVDGSKGAVPGATVTGAWSTGSSTSCTTDSTGTCTVSLNMGRKTTQVTWTLGTVTRAGYSYVAGGPTSVVVTAPQ